MFIGEVLTKDIVTKLRNSKAVFLQLIERMRLTVNVTGFYADGQGLFATRNKQGNGRPVKSRQLSVFRFFDPHPFWKF